MALSVELPDWSVEVRAIVKCCGIRYWHIPRFLYKLYFCGWSSQSGKVNDPTIRPRLWFLVTKDKMNIKLYYISILFFLHGHIPIKVFFNILWIILIIRIFNSQNLNDSSSTFCPLIPSSHSCLMFFNLFCY